jgi:hypothetical protein
MPAVLPLIEFQQSEAKYETSRSNLASLQAHFPNAPTLPGDKGIKDAAYRKACLQFLLSDEPATIPLSDPLRGNDYASSYWVDSTYKRNFGDNGSPRYSDVKLVAAAGDGKPESPYYPNLGSGADADPSNLPLVPAVSDPAVTNDLSSVKAAGSEGSVKSRVPRTYSNRMKIESSADIDSTSGKLSLTKGNSRITMKGSATKFGS